MSSDDFSVTTESSRQSQSGDVPLVVGFVMTDNFYTYYNRHAPCTPYYRLKKTRDFCERNWDFGNYNISFHAIKDDRPDIKPFYGYPYPLKRRLLGTDDKEGGLKWLRDNTSWYNNWFDSVVILDHIWETGKKAGWASKRSAMNPNKPDRGAIVDYGFGDESGDLDWSCPVDNIAVHELYHTFGGVHSQARRKKNSQNEDVATVMTSWDDPTNCKTQNGDGKDKRLHTVSECTRDDVIPPYIDNNRSNKFEGHMVGDVNRDGQITMRDAELIQEYLAELDPEPFDKIHADVDRDHEISIVDAVIIHRYLDDEIDDVEKYLEVKNFNVSPSPAPPGEPVEITATIANQGEFGALDTVRCDPSPADIRPPDIHSSEIIEKGIDIGGTGTDRDVQDLKFTFTIPEDTDAEAYIFEIKTDEDNSQEVVYIT